MSRLRRSAAYLAALLLTVWVGAAIWLALSAKATKRRAVFRRPTPWIIAHRGGAVQWPENTELAFTRCVERGVDVLELDIHASRDGELVVIHDATVDRTTDGSGPVADKSLEELRALDAAYRWGESKGHPFRGQGIQVPTLGEVLGHFPKTRINIEMKADGLEAPLCELIRSSGAQDRVIVASLKTERLEKFRSLCPEVATSASLTEALEFWALAHVGLAASPPAQALQLAQSIGDLPVITGPLLWAAQKRGLVVHVFTVNEPAEMKRFASLGVDGIMTDDPGTLAGILGR